jgi:NAD(P)-dependent dehydrogenase (short-subunit alcohol dehydrogenase family)
LAGRHGGGGGIGAALAERLLQAGALVPISDLDGSQLEELAARTARTRWRKLAPIGEALRSQWRKILLGGGLMFSSNALFYVSMAGVLDCGTRELGISRDTLLTASML